MASTSYPRVTLPELPHDRSNTKISFSKCLEKAHFSRKSRSVLSPRIVHGHASNFSLRCSVADVDSTKEKTTSALVEVKTWYTLFTFVCHSFLIL